jgi:hypothetical protein
MSRARTRWYAEPGRSSLVPLSCCGEAFDRGQERRDGLSRQAKTRGP